ncbi:phage major capsid protein [Tsuneonella sp. HG249]
MNRVVSLRPQIKGRSLVQLAIALGIAPDDLGTAARVAKARFGEDSLAYRIASVGGFDQVSVVKAEVAAGSTASGNWALLLEDTEAAVTEFFAYVRDRSIIGRLAGLRRVPLRTRLISAATGFSAAWVGEGKAKPVSKATYAAGTLPSRKVSTIAVVTRELLESVDPAAETLIRNDLAAALVAVIDQSFIDPANAGTTDIEPASVTNGVTAVTSTGDGIGDLRLLIDAFPGDLERAVLVGSPSTFAALHDPHFLPTLGVRGGTAMGIPAIPSNAAGDTLALIDPEGIAVGEDGMEIRTSNQASIEMLDGSLAGDSIGVVPGTAASTVSLWQTNSSAILLEQRINWETARPSVAIIEGLDQS